MLGKQIETLISCKVDTFYCKVDTFSNCVIKNSFENFVEKMTCYVKTLTMLTGVTPVSRNISVAITHNLLPTGVELIKEHFKDIEFPTKSRYSHEELVEKAARNDILLAGGVDVIDKEILDQNKLKFVSVNAAGINLVDLDYATEKGILISSVHSHAETVADLMIGLFLGLSRRIAEAGAYVKSGQWVKFNVLQFLGVDFHHKTMGIIGAGSIGKAIGRRAKGFGMKVLYNDILPGYEPLEKVLMESDFVTLCTPLSKETYKMFGKKQFEMMKPTAIFGNIGRGCVVDTQALTEAIESNTIYGAALDVIDPEPFPVDHPLLKHPRVLISPHMGAATMQCRNSMAREAALHCVEYLQGKRLHFCNNPEVYNHLKQ